MIKPQRFVILQHDHPVLHWDLMLDTGEVLRTWRLEVEPASQAEMRAFALPDHRRMYLDYEGPVSGDRGTVTRWDAGTYTLLEETPSRLRYQVDGHLMQGIVQMDRGIAGDEWTFELHNHASEAF